MKKLFIITIAIILTSCSKEKLILGEWNVDKITTSNTEYLENYKAIFKDNGTLILKNNSKVIEYNYSVSGNNILINKYVYKMQLKRKVLIINANLKVGEFEFKGNDLAFQQTSYLSK